MKRSALIIALALTIAIVAVSSVEFRTDIGDFFFDDQTNQPGFLAAKLQTDALARQYIIGISSKGSRPVAAAFLSSFQESLSTIPEVGKVGSAHPGLEELHALAHFYSQYSVALSSMQSGNSVAHYLEDAGLYRQADVIKQALLGPDPFLIKSLLQHDPMLLTLHWMTKLNALTNPSTEADVRFVTLIVDSKVDGLNLEKQKTLQAKIWQLFDDANLATGEAHRMQLTGVPVFASAISDDIKAEMRLIGTLSSFAVIGVFIIVFRSLRSLLITTVLLAFCVSAAVIATQWIFTFVHGLTMAFGATLIGVCVDYFIHGMVHGSKKDGDAPHMRIQRIWPSLVLGGLTTMIGYIAVGISGFPGFLQVSVFACTGIVTALLVTRFALPELISTLRLEIEPRLPIKGLLTVLGRTGPRAIIVGSICSIFAAGAFSLEWSQGLDGLAPDLAAMKNVDRELRRRSLSVEPGRFLLVQDDTDEGVLRKALAVQQALQQATISGQLKHFTPVYPWILPRSVQENNIKQWESYLRSGLQARWNKALEERGLRASGFPDLVNQPLSLLEPEQLRQSPAWPLLQLQFLYHGDKHMVVFWLGRHDVDSLRSLAEKLPDTLYVSQKDEINSLADRYRQQALWLLAVGGFLIIVLLTWRLGSTKQATLALAPALLAVAGVIGAWGLMGQQVTFIHIVGLLLSIAICVDYGIFIVENRCGSLDRTFQAIFASALTTCISFACLGLSSNPALDALSLTVAPAVVVGLLGCSVSNAQFQLTSNRQW